LRQRGPEFLADSRPLLILPLDRDLLDFRLTSSPRFGNLIPMGELSPARWIEAGVFPGDVFHLTAVKPSGDKMKNERKTL
jgi:hypothetical protein